MYGLGARPWLSCITFRCQSVTRPCRHVGGKGTFRLSLDIPSWQRPLTGRALRSVAERSHKERSQSSRGSEQWRLQTLAIETSCDDTSVAVLSISGHGDARLRTSVLFHEKITAKSEDYKGIHPIVALDSHQRELGVLVQRAILKLDPEFNSKHPIVSRTYEERSTGPEGLHSHSAQVETKPDFVTVTRGPGMRSNLSVGLELAKGLAAAWRVPLVGIHHMQAHALTPRLCAALDASRDVLKPDSENNRDSHSKTKAHAIDWQSRDLEPRFPFLSVLASGGHTLLIDSKTLTEHSILAETADIAIGDCLDKAARAILPESQLTMPYGKALEDFAFPCGTNYNYTAPAKRQDELERRPTRWGWSLGPPLAESKGGDKSSRRMVYSFAGLCSSVIRLMSQRIDEEAQSPLPPLALGSKDIWQEERRGMAREVQRVAFEHLGSRILLYLSDLSPERRQEINTVVVSGGVASNNFLRHVLRSMLDARGNSSIKLCFPPPELCTDNALMIAWAGMEMYDVGYESDMSIRPLRKWSMDSAAEDGGILGVGGWKPRNIRQGD